jgi:ABC-type Fe3+ transport system substrate-binding protein
MNRSVLISLLALALLLAVPLLWRAPAAPVVAATDRLVVITPHTESIRFEFGEAFQKHWRARTGREILIDWRSPGGTTDITRFLDDQYRTAFRAEWTGRLGREWSREVADGFTNAKLKLDDPTVPAAARDARRAFLASEAGIGIDLFFGGGQYDHHRQAQRGQAVDAGIQKLHPDWFGDAAIPQSFSGETFWDPQGRYYGACVSTFGICYNLDRLAELADATPPKTWLALADPRFRGTLLLADPTKSGSVNRCFEMMVQQQMAAARQTGQTGWKETGWAAGFNLIRQLGANAAIITDSASKVTRDVNQGIGTAGICIDFYGRTEVEWSATHAGRERMLYLTPAAGSSVSADPIQLLRGAPNRTAAIAFIEFVLSPEGQKLWNYRVGEPGGPVKYALRRLPIRRDLYGEENRRHMSDPQADPWREGVDFTYDPTLTGAHFNLIRTLFKCMVLDPLPELQEAWNAILAAGGPQAVPEAMAEFSALPFAYAKAGEAGKQIDAGSPGNTPEKALAAQRDWTRFFQEHYRRAAELAKVKQAEMRIPATVQEGAQ